MKKCSKFLFLDFLYKSLPFLFILLIPLLIILLILNKHDSSDILFITSFFLLVYIFITISLIVLKFAKKQYNKLIDILITDCDPYEFLYKFEPLTKKKKVLDMDNKITLIVYANGINLNGNIEKAMEINENLLKTLTKEKDSAILSLIYCNICNYYCQIDNLNIDEAKSALQKAKKFLNKSKNNQLYSSCRIQISNLYQTIMFLEGDTDAPLQYFLNALDTCQSKCDTVNTHYMIATIYEQKQDEMQKIEHLKYVAENGNKLHIANIAREQLKELE